MLLVALFLSRWLAAETSEKETEIDWLAFKLHQLTLEEIAIVEKQK